MPGDVQQEFVRFKMKKALVYLWTGSGAGKTTSALRAVGHGQKVVVIQFMKGKKDIGEYKIKNRLKPNYEIYQFGHSGWIYPNKITLKDKELAKNGLNFAKKIIFNF